jgi:hypothetical protein
MYTYNLYKQERQYQKACNDLFSTAVPKIRQFIESFFKRLKEKTTVQRDQKVRSIKRSLIHTMGSFHLSNFLNTDSH